VSLCGFLWIAVYARHLPEHCRHQWLAVLLVGDASVEIGPPLLLHDEERCACDETLGLLGPTGGQLDAGQENG
jgi:hypothetical protein